MTQSIEFIKSNGKHVSYIRKQRECKYNKRLTIKVNQEEYETLLSISSKKFGKNNFNGMINYLIEKELKNYE